MAAILTPDDLRARCRVLACGCWLWRGDKGTGAAPAFRFPPLASNVSAGIAACWWALGRRPLPGEAWHITCGTRRCMNPAHRTQGNRASQMLAAGLKRSDQTRLRMAAGRRTAGKLSDVDVAELRACGDTLEVIAARYGISVGYACELRSGKRRAVALARDVVVTKRPRRRGRYEVEQAPALFSALRPGEYLPGETALSVAYGGAK